MNDEIKKRIASLLWQGKTLREVGKESGSSYHTMRLKLAESGLEIKSVLVDRATGRVIFPDGTTPEAIR